MPPWALRGLVLPLGLLLLVHACALDTVRVSGSSMEKTLEPGDFVLVSKLAVTRAALTGSPYLPRRGDVVVFRLPKNHSLVLIKRVVALPGESVTLADGSAHVVGEGAVFVEGDNRAPGASNDSRDWGDLPAHEIVGTAVLRLLPWSQAGRFS